MSSRAPDLLGSIFSAGSRPSVPAFPGSMIPMKVRTVEGGLGEALAPPSAKRRTAIWDMHHSVHCSIIGTCLSGGEIRRLLIKLGVHGAETAGDHDLHKQGVVLAGRQHGGAKLIQKALDHRHEAAIKQFARAKDEAALLQMWDEAVKRGDIPGAYWAVLSHPAATDAIMRKTFGDVHMLSHMVGAANRADIRRLRQLEEENAALAAKIELQQGQLRDGFTVRDDKIRLLNEALARALAQAPVAAEHAGDDARAAKEALHDLGRRLSRETARNERLENRLAAATRALSQAEQARQYAERECENLRRELALIEARIDAEMEGAKATGIALRGAQVLYVGGRANQVPQLKAIVESAGGEFLHHDGGVEHGMALLPGLISRADCAVFPVDCISHDAMGVVKRQCRQSAKPFVPLRTSSLASLVSALATLEPKPECALAIN
jgi:Uncharacterized protein conserved in bacteria (DUF2325)